ncbi:MAG: hypothetical protein JSV01_03140, partial [Desulfobacterales bacterium]
MIGKALSLWQGCKVASKNLMNTPYGGVRHPFRVEAISKMRLTPHKKALHKTVGFPLWFFLTGVPLLSKSPNASSLDGLANLR